MSTVSKSHTNQLPPPVVPNIALSALAPMQDITTLGFMQLLASYGAPDYFFTEYFRVHVHSRLEPHILASIAENKTGRPVFAQLIGEHIPDMVRTVHDLLQYPVAGIDLNMGCPAPKVYKKNAGGGLLRDPDHIDELIGALREAIPGLFTVKMRLGFETHEHYPRVLKIIEKHKVDSLTVHGRTVKGMYHSEVDYDAIKQAVNSVPCPVFANGNITSGAKALWTMQHTGCAGVMIGRSAIRNPWIFKQTRELLLHGEVRTYPTLKDVFGYIRALHSMVANPTLTDILHVSGMKRFLIFIGQAVDPQGAFLHDVRRVRSSEELWTVCERYLDSDKPFSDEPFSGIVARPNRELDFSCSNL
jgi:tRNA-dihydrouridine synthase B